MKITVTADGLREPERTGMRAVRGVTEDGAVVLLTGGWGLLEYISEEVMAEGIAVIEDSACQILSGIPR